MHPQLFLPRGVTTCLMCNGSVEFAVINNFGLLYGINLIYETHKYNIMLQSTKVCIKCAGRLHQLFDFNLIKSTLDIHSTDAFKEIDGMNCCRFCDDGEPMGEQFDDKVNEAVEATKWAESSGAKAKSCFSCYNFLIFFTETKATLDIQCVLFYQRIKNCRVFVVKEEKIDDESKAIVHDLKLKTVEQLGPVELEHGNINDDTSTQALFVNKSKLLLNPVVVTSCIKLDEKLKRKKRPEFGTKFMLKRLQLQDCNENHMETVDKFTAIKQRRSRSISVVATPPPAKKQKSLPRVISEPQTSGLQNTASKIQQDCNENEVDKFTAIKQRRSRSISVVRTPVVKEQRKKKSVSKPKIEKETKAKQMEDSEALNSIVELHTEDHENVLNVAPLNISSPSKVLQKSQSYDFESFESYSENLLQLLPVETTNDLTLRPSAMISESTAITTMDTMTYECYKKLYNLRECQISCVQIDQKKLEKILAKRSYTSHKMTKSGRIAKPSVVYDPSPEPRQIKTIKVKKQEKKLKVEALLHKSQTLKSGEGDEPGQPKEKGCSEDANETQVSEEKCLLKKSEDKPEKSESSKKPRKTKDKSQKSDGKLRRSGKKFFQRGFSPKIIKFKKSPFLVTRIEQPSAPAIELEYPEEFPESIEIEEDYVEYATSYEPSPKYVKMEPSQLELTTTVEFLAESFQHKGKIIFRNYPKQFPPRVPSIRRTMY